MRNKRIAIIGMGLIGGSLGLAFRQSGQGLSVCGIDQDERTLELCVACGAADDSTANAMQGVQNADVVFLCTPVLQIVPLVKEILPYLKPGCIVTDVGSTKGILVEEITALLPAGIHYVSGHPMAGREQSGILAARADLFYDKCYIIVPEGSSCPQAVSDISSLLALTGANLTTMKVDDHDKYAAIISHVPHVAAAGLVNLLALYPDLEDNFKLVGGGFRDTTRIASSNADMWADVCLTNSQPIIDSLQDLQMLLEGVVKAIRREDRPALRQYFADAKERRDALIEKTDSHITH